MYLDHFGLREAPFRITPHTEFFFAGANRGATLEALIYAITEDEGIVKVSGEVGSGKTMLCRMLLEKLPNRVETVYLANPSLSRDEILHAIADELQAPLPEGRAHQLQRSLQDRLLDIYASGRQVVVMIDEAHAMPPEALEEVRLLSNLESNRHKLLHIVLFGQPELDERLAETGMRQLKERITHNFTLEPLRRGDIGNYLMFRMRAAGYRGPDIFSPKAVQLISKISEGLTRRVNILADKALLSAYSEGKHHIENRQVKAAIRDAQFTTMRGDRFAGLKWIAGALAAIVVAGLAFLAGHTYQSPLMAAPSNGPVTEEAAAATRNDISPASPPPAREAAATPSPVDTASPAPAPEPPARQPATLSERIATTEEWLNSVPDAHYFIQLLSADAGNQRDIENFLENRTRTLDPQQVRVYRSKLSGRDRLGIIYGDYPTRETALAELEKLSQAESFGSPYVRSVRKLR